MSAAERLLTGGRALVNSSRRAADGAFVVPRLTFNAVRHGVISTATWAPLVVLQEGPWGLHWKMVGDALVRFAQHSGPLLTKLGQILATRTDILPEGVCARLEKLYARQPAMTRRQLDAALATAFPHGLPFRTFDRRPIAAGSIAQIHRATLGDGAGVVVKLVRPGLKREIERDVNAAGVLLQVLLAVPGVLRRSTRSALRRALDELGVALRAEVDLRQEAASLEEFGRRLRWNPRVRVPRVYRHWCGETVLVMEELVGEPLSEYRARMKSDPAGARRVADLAFKEILKQVFEDGRFHADPHAGNLLILPDGRLGLIDLGLTGEATQADRTRIARAVRAFVSGDPEALVRALLGFGVPPPDFRFDDFKADVLVVVRRNEAQVVAHMTGKSREDPGIASTRLETFIQELFRVAESHNLYVPPSSTLLIKTIVTIEGVARSLDPDLNVVAAAIPIVLRSISRRWLRWGFWRESA
jgi:ubiquinone biosynthesis protein